MSNQPQFSHLRLSCLSKSLEVKDRYDTLCWKKSGDWIELEKCLQWEVTRVVGDVKHDCDSNLKVDKVDKAYITLKEKLENEEIFDEIYWFEPLQSTDSSSNSGQGSGNNSIMISGDEKKIVIFYHEKKGGNKKVFELEKNSVLYDDNLRVKSAKKILYRSKIGNNLDSKNQKKKGKKMVFKLDQDGGELETNHATNNIDKQKKKKKIFFKIEDDEDDEDDDDDLTGLGGESSTSNSLLDDDDDDFLKDLKKSKEIKLNPDEPLFDEDNDQQQEEEQEIIQELITTPLAVYSLKGKTDGNPKSGGRIELEEVEDSDRFAFSQSVEIKEGPLFKNTVYELEDFFDGTHPIGRLDVQERELGVLRFYDQIDLYEDPILTDTQPFEQTKKVVEETGDAPVSERMQILRNDLNFEEIDPIPKLIEPTSIEISENMPPTTSSEIYTTTNNSSHDDSDIPKDIQDLEESDTTTTTAEGPPLSMTSSEFEFQENQKTVLGKEATHKNEDLEPLPLEDIISEEDQIPKKNTTSNEQEGSNPKKLIQLDSNSTTSKNPNSKILYPQSSYNDFEKEIGGSVRIIEAPIPESDSKYPYLHHGWETPLIEITTKNVFYEDPPLKDHHPKSQDMEFVESAKSIDENVGFSQGVNQIGQEIDTEISEEGHPITRIENQEIEIFEGPALKDQISYKHSGHAVGGIDLEGGKEPIEDSTAVIFIETGGIEIQENPEFLGKKPWRAVKKGKHATMDIDLAEEDSIGGKPDHLEITESPSLLETQPYRYFRARLGEHRPKNYTDLTENIYQGERFNSDSIEIHEDAIAQAWAFVWDDETEDHTQVDDIVEDQEEDVHSQKLIDSELIELQPELPSFQNKLSYQNSGDGFVLDIVENKYEDEQEDIIQLKELDNFAPVETPKTLAKHAMKVRGFFENEVPSYEYSENPNYFMAPAGIEIFENWDTTNTVRRKLKMGRPALKVAMKLIKNARRKRGKPEFYAKGQKVILTAAEPLFKKKALVSENMTANNEFLDHEEGRLLERALWVKKNMDKSNKDYVPSPKQVEKKINMLKKLLAEAQDSMLAAKAEVRRKEKGVIGQAVNLILGW